MHYLPGLAGYTTTPPNAGQSKTLVGLPKFIHTYTHTQEFIMPYSTTTVTIDYNTDALQFATDQEYAAFLQAVGRMVVYAMQNTDERAETLVALGVDKDKEITGVYYHTPPLGAVEAALDQAKVSSAIARRPFVMGAVPRYEDDANPDVVTRFSYHS